MTIVQFNIRRLAADSLDLETMKERARVAGIDDVRLGWSTVRAPTNHVRVTASIPMALMMAELLKATTLESAGDTLFACAGAAKTILDEVTRTSESAGRMLGTAPNLMG